jgi:hypothetical protein
VALEVGTNSYVSVEEADAFFADRFLAEPFVGVWGNATSEDKEKALITATQRVDANRFVGAKADPLQALEFPRRYDVREGDEPGVLVETAVLPNVKRAVFEESLALLAGTDDSLRARLQREGVTSARIGGASETYSGAGAGSAQAGLASAAAAEYLRPYLKARAAFG